MTEVDHLVGAYSMTVVAYLIVAFLELKFFFFRAILRGSR